MLALATGSTPARPAHRLPIARLVLDDEETEGMEENVNLEAENPSDLPHPLIADAEARLAAIEEAESPAMAVIRLAAAREAVARLVAGAICPQDHNLSIAATKAVIRLEAAQRVAHAGLASRALGAFTTHTPPGFA